MKLQDLGISFNHPAFIVAEISANHFGNKDKCIDLIDIAAESGANAVKFQTYRAETITLKTNQNDFKIPNESPWHSFVNLYELYLEASTPWEWHYELFQYAKSRNLIAFSSAFDESSVDFLDSLNTPMHKLASPEINHLPLIKKMAKSGKPILISLGVASEYDLRTALKTIENNGNSEVVVMQCDTNYPADVSNANISQIKRISCDYECITGYSDHTLSSLTAVLALSAGAKVFEKHLAIGGGDQAIDSFFSADKMKFTEYVKDIRLAEDALGKPIFRSSDNDAANRSKRSIYPKKDIKKGEVFSNENIGIYRPGLSMAPEKFDWIIGKRAARDLLLGDRIFDSDVDF